MKLLKRLDLPGKTKIAEWLIGVSKPPPSASRPPHRIELTIVAQGLADFRLSTLIADFARLSLKLSLSRRSRRLAGAVSGSLGSAAQRCSAL
jgi:hypothetical protein